MKKILAIFFLITLFIPQTSFAAFQVEGVGGAVLTCAKGDKALLKAAGGLLAKSDVAKKGLEDATRSVGSFISGLFTKKPAKSTDTGIASLIDRDPTAALRGSKIDPSKMLKISPKLDLNNVSSGLGSSAVPTEDKNAKSEIEKQGADTKKAIEANTQEREQRERCLNAIAYAVARTTLLNVQNKTFNWINTGFNGNPLYVQDVNSYLKSISNNNINQFISTAQKRDPIFGNAIRSIVTQQTTGKIDGLIDETLNTPEAAKYQKNMRNFASGGWGSFLNVKANPISAVFNASDELSQKIGIDTQNTREELLRNGGFMDSKECVEWQKDGRVVTKPGDNGLSGEVKCTKWRVLLPGSLTKNRAETFLTTDVRQLELADTMSKTVSALFDKIINNILSKGLRSAGTGVPGFEGPATGLSGGNSGGPGSNIVLGSNGIAIAQGKILGGASTDFELSNLVQLRSLVQTQYDFINASKDTYTVSQKITPTLGELDYCLPGPNPSWYEKVQTNKDLILGAIGAGDGTVRPPWQFIVPKYVLKDTSLNDSIIFKPQTLNVLNKKPTYEQPLPNNFACEIVKNLISAGSLGLFSGAINCERAKLVANPLDPSNISDGVIEWFQQYATKTIDVYSTENIINAFLNTSNSSGNDKVYVKGLLTDALTETANIDEYNTQMIALANERAETIEFAEKYSAQLQTIYDKTQTIVKNARARKEKALQDANTSSNEMMRINACLDTKYLVKKGRIVGNPRQENNDLSSKIATSRTAREFFYNNRLVSEGLIEGPVKIPTVSAIGTASGGTLAPQGSIEISDLVFSALSTAIPQSWNMRTSFVANGDSGILQGNFTVTFTKNESGRITTNGQSKPYNRKGVIILSENAVTDLSTLTLRDTIRNKKTATSTTTISSVTYIITVTDNLTNTTLFTKQEERKAPFL